MTTTTISRDISATLIPAGTPTTLAAGTEIHIVQTLGGNVTVRTGSGLYRIASDAVGAIVGFDARQAPTNPVSDTSATFSEQGVWDAMRSCFDPEIPVNIVDLGLVYDVSVEPGTAGGHRVEVKMTLTAQGCGMGPVIAEDARSKIAQLPGVEEAKVHIVWDPIWTPQMISPDGRKALGLE